MSMRRVFIIFMTWVIVVGPPITHASNLTLTQQLNDSITRDYNKFLLPLSLQNDAARLMCDSVFAILDCDTVITCISAISVLGYLTVLWTDQRVGSDPLLFGGKSSMLMPHTDVWTPSLYITHPVGKW
jgi:hypothetical protein